MKIQPTVSYIMTTFNNEETIKDSLNSINHLNPQIPVEIVIVNDGSTDNTKVVIDSFDFVILNRILHLKSNIGRPAAANLAIKESKGKYIAILDADDLEMNQRLKKSVDILDNNLQIDLVCGQYIKFGIWGESLETSKLPTKPKEIAQALARFRNPVAHSSSMYRRSWFDNLQGYSELFPRCQDLELFVRGFNGSNYEVSTDVFLKYRTSTRSHSFKYYLEEERWRLKVALTHSKHTLFIPKDSTLSNLIINSVIYLKYGFYFIKNFMSTESQK
jgi:glycosyltransferase involved in cell wall biosynthesis